jgi:hypothetical protein
MCAESACARRARWCLAPSTDVYNQSIPSSGYGYLTTRDGIQPFANRTTPAQ